MKAGTGKKALLGLSLAVLLAAAGILLYLALTPGTPAGSAESPSVGQETELYDYPPFVLVNDRLYKSELATEPIDLESYVFLGEISSTVPGFEMPTENFQANRNILGAAVYLRDERLIVDFNGKILLYLLFEEEDG